MINFGIIPLILKNEEDYDSLSEGEELYIEGLATALRCEDEVTLTTKNKKIPLLLTLTDRQREILLSGGLLEYTKANGKEK